MTNKTLSEIPKSILSKALELFTREPGKYGKYDPGSLYGAVTSEKQDLASMAMMMHGGVRPIPGNFPIANLSNQKLVELAKQTAAKGTEKQAQNFTSAIIQHAYSGRNPWSKGAVNTALNILVDVFHR